MTHGPEVCSSSRHWTEDILTKIFAFPAFTGLNKWLPFIILVRNRQVLSGEKIEICTEWSLRTDGSLHTDLGYPASFRGVINNDKSDENFRGHFAVHQLTFEEANYKFCEMRKVFVGTTQTDIF